jgi:hypothetical protein
MKKEMTWAYVTAFLEADGSICIYNSIPRKRNASVVLKWAQHSENSFVLDGMKEFLEEHNVIANIHQHRTRRTSKTQDMSYLVVGSYDSVEICLTEMIPYMWVKDEKAEQALEIILRVKQRPRGSLLKPLVSV